jgi:microcystin-dependent protein
VSDYFVGQILLVPFNFAPTGFAFCNGQTMFISQNTALFSLLGTMYGGNGQTTFALPDLQGRVAVAFGQGPGLSQYLQGAAAGTDVVTLDATQLAAHTHPVNASALTATPTCKNGAGDQSTPVGNVPAIEAASAAPVYSNAAPDANMRAGAVTVGGTATTVPAGGGLSHSNLQPYLTMNYIIALQGVFPARS